MNFEQHEMLTVAGYELERIVRRGRKTTVYRGRRELDGAQVILKCLHEQDPEPREVARLRREHEILNRFDDDNVVRAYALEPCGNGLALVLEDFGGRSLRHIAKEGRVFIRQFLEYALRICDALAIVHGRGVIHKDIKPDNIIVNVETGRLAIIDFSISTTLTEERQSVSNPDVLEGTLLYMSPEQTGRMNRRLDYRTDYYSLGVTFYELLTGRVPFDVDDPMELVHCHIARVPPALSTPQRPVPPTLEAIVRKLMAKTAETRYQSVVGIRADLQRCLAELERLGEISTFEPGANDVSENFQIPELLYGRDANKKSLLEAFDRVSGGGNEIVLVAGPSGIGKSAVIHEIHKPIVASRGYFIAGKFDQFTRDSPYASMIQAFRELVRLLLTEADDELSRWRERLMEALGRNAKVVTDVLPELALIIGEPAQVPELPAAESANRFRSTFRNLVRVFATEEHPLVIFLDDLQWSDIASLKLIELLLTDPRTSHLLWIGAFRDNEVGPGHLLLETLDDLRDAGVPVHREDITPLSLEHTAALIRDTLKPSLGDVDALSVLLQGKSGGNPFFLRVLLQSLYDQGIIGFDAERAGWRWDERRVEDARLSEDVVEIMAAKIGELTLDTREVLKLAACIGNRFDLSLLAIVAQEPDVMIAQHLWEALEKGLIRPVGDAYKYVGTAEDTSASGAESNRVIYQFVHDKVYQAAYSLLSESERRLAHLRIGRLLLRGRTEDELRERVFDIVSHLNIGIPLIENPEERRRVAELNLVAGRRATKSVAYDSAVSLLRQGIELLPRDAWREAYELTFSLYRGCMEAEYLNGNIDGAKGLYEPLLGSAATNLDRGDIYALKVTLDAGEKHNKEALATAIEGLQALGFGLPSASKSSLLREVARININLRRHRFEDIARLPEIESPIMRVALKVMQAAVAPAYFEDTFFAALIMLRIANLTLRNGMSEVSPFGFAGYGLFLSGILRMHRSAHNYAVLAETILERFQNPSSSVKVTFVTALFINSWVKPFSEVRKQLHEVYLQGFQIGEHSFALYAGVKKVTFSLLEGMNLRMVAETADTMFPQVQRLGELDGIGMLTAMKRAISCLRGELPAAPSFSGPEFDERGFERELHESSVHQPQAIFYFHLFKGMTLYLFGQHGEARRHFGELELRLETMLSQPVLVDFHFYYALNELAERAAGSGRQRRADRIVSRSVRLLRKWAESCPENFGARSQLLEAERARVLGRQGEALMRYNRALERARSSRSSALEALAGELAARMCMSTDQRAVGESYLRESRLAYRRWGALAKVERLNEEFPGILPRSASLGITGVELDVFTPRDTTTSQASSFDIRSVVRASQAISSEIKIEPLLRALVREVLRNAGAQHGSLLLMSEDGLRLEAEFVAEPEEIHVLQSRPLDDCTELSRSIVKYVARTRSDVVLDDAAHEGAFTKDPYVVERRPRSVLCTPLIFKSEVSGMLYLENNLATGAFTPDRTHVLKQLSSQVAISVANARLYDDLDKTARELEIALESARAADRAKTQFLMNMSHELRTPLNAVIGYTELIEEEAEDGDMEAFLSDLGKIRQSANRLLRTLTSILELSRLEVGDSTPQYISVALGDLIRRVREEVGDEARKRRNTLAFELEDGLTTVQSDSWMLYYCLMSMLDNAVRFTENGAVTCRVSRYIDGGRAWVRYDIRDTGIGIAEKDRGKLFAAFDQADYSTTRTFEGSGVSLAVVYRYAELLGGAVTVESEPGAGSTFTLRLPAEPPGQGHAAEELSELRAASR
ncbi:MAG: AAA family ATPase [Myxococcales bacterium]|nr:AAA family ATPase [Myxococcales bacterium]